MRSLPIAKIAALAVLLFATPAFAAGLFIAPRGIRPLSRGGAFVAGADDVHALSYNPAGMSYAKNQVLVDFALQFYSTDFTRRITPTSDPMETVHGSGLKLPLPTIGFVHDFGLVKGLTFGASLGAEYPGLQNWPNKLSDGSPAPQRYAIEDYHGTAIIKVSAGAAYRIIPELSVGLAIQTLAGNFKTAKTVSACDGVVCTLAEDPEHDTGIQLAAHNIIAPGVHIGAIYQPMEWLKIGASWESGYHVSSGGDLNTRLPSAAEYDAASLDPAKPRANVSFNLPWTARFGVEAASDLVRVEIAAVHEHWKTFDTIEIEPQDVYIRNVIAIGDYKLSQINLEPRFKSIWSVRLGTEWTPKIGEDRPLAMRFGFMYEPSAIPDEHLSPVFIDLNKTILSAGAGYRFGKIIVDLTYAHSFMQSRSIRNSQVEQVNPLRPGFPGRTFVGNGDYSGSSNIFGLGLRYFFDET